MRPEWASLAAEQAAVAARLTAPALWPDMPWRVHRNNLWAAWDDAMVANFPVTCEVLGHDAFIHAARSFLRAFPPPSPVLQGIGVGFGAHLASDEFAQFPAYVPDLARLEEARMQVFLAPARPVPGPELLSAFDPEHVLDLIAELNPALRRFRSDHPIDVIFDLHETGAIHERSDIVDLPARGTTMIISRPADDVEMFPVDPAVLTLIDCLEHGLTLGVALERSGGIQAALPYLQLILARRLVVGLRIGE